MRIDIKFYYTNNMEKNFCIEFDKKLSELFKLEEIKNFISLDTYHSEIHPEVKK